jgi:hypothetical protein
MSNRTTHHQTSPISWPIRLLLSTSGSRFQARFCYFHQTLRPSHATPRSLWDLFDPVSDARRKPRARSRPFSSTRDHILVLRIFNRKVDVFISPRRPFVCSLFCDPSFSSAPAARPETDNQIIRRNTFSSCVRSTLQRRRQQQNQMVSWHPVALLPAAQSPICLSWLYFGAGSSLGAPIL